MNRFLTRTTAMALGLALGGLAKADALTNHDGFERDRNAGCDRHGLPSPFYWDGLQYFDPWQWPLYWDGLRYFDHRWHDPDLRHFDDQWRVNHCCTN